MFHGRCRPSNGGCHSCLMSSWSVTEDVLELGDTEVERGGVIRGARLAWQAHGTLNAAKDNVIVHPCSYTATHEDLAELVGPDLILDPEKWFIVIPDMFSNGLSSSAADDPGFPAVVTAGDNVRAQRRLLHEQWGHRPGRRGLRLLNGGSRRAPTDHDRVRQ